MSAPNSPKSRAALGAGIALAIAVVVLVGALVITVGSYNGLAAERERLAQAEQQAEQAKAETKAVRDQIKKLEEEHPGLADWPKLKEQAVQRCSEFTPDAMPVTEAAAAEFDAGLTTTPLMEGPLEARICPREYWAMAKGHAVLTATQATVGSLECTRRASGEVDLTGTFTPTLAAEVIGAGVTSSTFTVAASAGDGETELATQEVNVAGLPDEPVTWSAALTEVPASATSCTIRITSWWPDEVE